MQWKYWVGAGGGCANSVRTSGSPGPGIASPSLVSKLLHALAGLGANATSPQAAGGSSSEGGGCNVFIGIVTSAPTGGFGAGSVRKVTFKSDGSYTGTGESVSVMFPYV